MGNGDARHLLSHHNAQHDTAFRLISGIRGNPCARQDYSKSHLGNGGSKVDGYFLIVLFLCGGC